MTMNENNEIVEIPFVAYETQAARFKRILTTICGAWAVSVLALALVLIFVIQ